MPVKSAQVLMKSNTNRKTTTKLDEVIKLLVSLVSGHFTFNCVEVDINLLYMFKHVLPLIHCSDEWLEFASLTRNCFDAFVTVVSSTYNCFDEFVALANSTRNWSLASSPVLACSPPRSSHPSDSCASEPPGSQRAESTPD